MARELDSIKEISDAKELWKFAVRIEDMWSVVNQFKIEHVEFLILDKQGDNIQVLLPTEQLPTWKPKLEEGQTYIMKNFRVLENDFTVKSSEHPYKLVFIAGDGGTDVIRQEIPDIPFHKFKFKPFIEIQNGNYRPDRLVDIIGVVHEITQVPNTSGPKKLPTTFTISDTGCNKLTVTLWDDYGASFLKSFNEKGGEGPFVVIIKHARIKEAQGNFGLTITNAWNGTKLIIDSQLPQVKDFVQSLSEDFLSQTPALSQSGSTQIMTPQAYASSMYTTAEKYTYRAPPKHLSELMTLPEEFMCTTVATPHHVMASRNGWYYLSCTICSKGVIPAAKALVQRVLARNKDLQLTDDQIDNLTLSAIETLLQANRRSLKEFGSIPYPKGFVIAQLGNRLIYEERNYNRQQLNEEYLQLYALLTDEQREIFKKITSAVRSQNGGVFFLHGYGGTGKTFLYTTIASTLRSKGDIVLTVATSGIASLLLPGGRTAHSKFKIPVPTLENSMCRMDGDSEDAELLRQTKLIIWDEAPMAHKYTFECLDRTLKDIMCGRLNSPKLFGGKVVVFGGDFRQILPVIPRGSRSDIVNASINASYIWDHCQVLTLTKNMRLQIGSAGATNENIAEFAKWILKVGEGKLSEPNDGNAEIEIPTEFLIPKTDNPIKAIVESTYPDLLQHYQNEDFLKSRAILASTIEVVDEINNHILNLIPGEEIEYLSSNSIDQSQINEPGIFDVVTPEFLSTLRTSGLPNHKIKLKIGTPIMLMRNLDQSEGLCNGTRLIITKLANHVLEARIISGKNKGNIAYIPRMTTSPSQSPWPFTLSRRQFPITVSYAMTINKSQGQSLANVGLYLPRSVFSHGQLYVALSRVKSKAGLKILINNNDSEVSSSTTNVVFKEVFQNV